MSKIFYYDPSKHSYQPVYAQALNFNDDILNAEEIINKINQAGKVQSVNGKQGKVELVAKDIPMNQWTSLTVEDRLGQLDSNVATLNTGKADKGELKPIRGQIDELETITLTHDDKIKQINTNKADKSYVKNELDKTTPFIDFVNLQTDVESLSSDLKYKADKSQVTKLNNLITSNNSELTKRIDGNKADINIQNSRVNSLDTKINKLDKSKLDVTAKKDYASYSTLFGVYRVDTDHNLQINASSEASIDGEHSQLNATDGCTITESQLAQINASSNSLVEANRGQINASSSCECLGNWSQINSSYKSATHGQVSSVNSSWDSITDAGTSMIGACRDTVVTKFGSSAFSCRNTTLNTSDSVVLASSNVEIPHYRGYVVTGGANPNASRESTQNRTWQIESLSGQIRAKGSVVGNSSFADFAEYMESSNGKQIPIGTIVALDDKQKIKVAQPNDNPIGIISATAGIILNAQGFEWKDRYLYDRYGQPILVEQEVEDVEAITSMYDEFLLHTQETGEYLSIEEYKNTLPQTPTKLEKLPLLNLKYDPNIEYTPREERDEWNVVGMKGQIYVNIDETVKEHGYIKVGENGIATDGIIEVEYNGIKAHKLWQVMEVTTPYTEELGYGIARVII